MKRIAINGSQLNVADQGQGPPLLLVHGFPLDHTMWQRQIEPLSDTFRVIAPDLRGFGGSDISPGVVSLEQMADDLADLLSGLHVDQPVTLCGLSMGGYIAWQFWRRHRGRLGGLILCDTRAAADSPEAAKSRLEQAERVLAEGTRLLAEAMLEKLFAPDTSREQPELVETTRQTILSTSPIGAAAALRGMSQRQDARGWLPEIDVPTLVLCGRHDAIVPLEEMREMAARIPAARFVEITSAGHMAPLENPDQVNDAIRQWSRQS